MVLIFHVSEIISIIINYILIPVIHRNYIIQIKATNLCSLFIIWISQVCFSVFIHSFIPIFNTLSSGVEQTDALILVGR